MSMVQSNVRQNEAAPANLGDPVGVLVGRVVEDVDDEVMGEGEDEQAEAGQPHQVPDRELEAAALRPDPSGAAVLPHASPTPKSCGRPKIGARIWSATGTPTTKKTTQFRYQIWRW